MKLKGPMSTLVNITSDGSGHFRTRDATGSMDLQASQTCKSAPKALDLLLLDAAD